MTLACEDVNLKLVEVVAVADLDAEICVDHSFFLEILKLIFGHKAEYLFQTLRTRFGQDFEVWLIFLS